MEAILHNPEAQADRQERIREARLMRLREFLEQARAEHCFDNELDVADDRGRNDVEAIMALAHTLSVQRRAGVSVGFAEALAGADALKHAARSSEAIDAMRSELEAERAKCAREVQSHKAAAQREQEAHRQTADALSAAQRELAELKQKQQ